MNASQLKELYAHRARALSRHPELARGAGQVRVNLAADGSCHVEHEDGTLRVDLPAHEGGGGGSGPNPGQLMRASLGAGLVLGYRVWAARLEVPVGAIELRLACAFDARGELGLSTDAPLGWERLLVHVSVASAAPEADVRRVVDTADRLNPLLATLSSVKRLHRLTIVRPAATALAAESAPATTTERDVPSLVTPLK